MYSLFVLSLAVLGATAAPCSTGCGSNNCLPGPTFSCQTPVIQGPTSVIPGYVPTTSVSQSCHCLKTAVRPQLRTEVISVPQVDRIVRVVPSPIVEAVSVNCGCNTRHTNLPTCCCVDGCGISGGCGCGCGYPVLSGCCNNGCGCSNLVSGCGCSNLVSGCGCSNIVSGCGCGCSGLVSGCGCNSGVVGCGGCGCGCAC